MQCKSLPAVLYFRNILPIWTGKQPAIYLKSKNWGTWSTFSYTTDMRWDSCWKNLFVDLGPYCAISLQFLSILKDNEGQTIDTQDFFARFTLDSFAGIYFVSLLPDHNIKDRFKYWTLWCYKYRDCLWQSRWLSKAASCFLWSLQFSNQKLRSPIRNAVVEGTKRHPNSQ